MKRTVASLRKVNGLPLLFVLALRVASVPTANVSYFLLALYATLGRMQAIQALILSWFFSMLNSGIAPSASLAGVGRYAVLFAAAVSVMAHSNQLLVQLRVRTFTFTSVMLGFFIVVHSILLSRIPEVSILKAISWTLAVGTLMSAWGGLSEGQKNRVSRQLFFMLVSIAVISLPLIALPLGYLRNGSGFQGILIQPQPFGSTMALLGAWSAASVFGANRPTWGMMAILGVSILMVFLSEARTAGFSVVLGLSGAIFLAPIFSGQSIKQMAPGLRSRRVWLVLTVIFSIAIFNTTNISRLLENFVSKSGRVEASSLLEAYDLSRGGLIKKMTTNISAHPLTGIGFGIASNPARMEIRRDPIFGLPVGAAIEKGVAPLAVLEELGVFGATLVAIWVLLLLRGCSRAGLIPFAVTLTSLSLNMGEYTFFSTGGMGLLPMVLFGWAYFSRQDTGLPNG